MKKKLIGIVLALALIMTLLPITALAASLYSDTSNHWAQATIDKWSAWGVIQGSNGKFNPNDPITRGEMAVIIDRIMKYQTAAKNSFSDLGQAFYTNPILKATAAGIIVGDGKLVRPIATVTREEAAVMLGRSLGLTESTKVSSFKDNANISSWASGFVNALAAKGYINGFEGKFNPKANISRAEVVTILNNAITQLCNESKEYTSNVTGTVVVDVPGVVLKNLTITGDLIISEGVGNGEVTLKNIIVTGNTIVRGGGPNSIRIEGGQLANIIIDKTDDGQIRVVSANGAVINTVNINDGKDDIILTGSFRDVTINSDVPVKAVDADIETLNINAQNAVILVDKDSTVNALNAAATAKGAVITVSGNVTTLTTYVQIIVTNNGAIANAVIKANNVIIDGTEPAKVTVDPNVTIGPKDLNGNIVDGNTSPSGVYIPTVAVSSITVAGESSASEVVNGETLQMVATITPADATNKTVTWSVAPTAGPGAGAASIDSAKGILTGTSDGTVTVTATADNGVKGQATITVKSDLNVINANVTSATTVAFECPVSPTAVTWNGAGVAAGNIAYDSATQIATITVDRIMTTENTMTVSAADYYPATVTVNVTQSTGDLIYIVTAKELADAIVNQQDNQTWIITAGDYPLDPDITRDFHGETGWYCLLTANNLTICGEGNPILYGNAKTADTGAGLACQELITVYGDNITLKGLTLMPKVDINKTVEVVGDVQFTLDDCTFTPNTKIDGADPFNGGALFISGFGASGTKDILIENSFFYNTPINFNGRMGSVDGSAGSKISIIGNTFTSIKDDLYGIGNHYWGPNPTDQYGDIFIDGNNFIIASGTTPHIIDALLNQTFTVTANNRINGEPIDIDEFGQYLYFGDVSGITNNKVIVGDKTYSEL